MTDFELKRDCRHVRWDRPCAPHKARGKVCANCDEYTPARTRILMVKLAATGDVLRTTSFLAAIHARWPQAHVTWLTAPGAVALFERNPLVDQVWSSDEPLTLARLQTIEFDVVLCPDADPDAAALAALAKGDEHRGFRLDSRGQIAALSAAAGRWLQMGLDDGLKKRNTRTYQSLVAEVIGLDPLQVKEPVLVPADSDVAFARAFATHTNWRGPFVGLNTGAGGRWAYKQWTLAHQRTFLRSLTAAGRAVLLLGGPEEVQRHQDLLAAVPGAPVFDTGNHNSYGRFAALVELCATVVTSDSLCVHVAAARKVPAIVLFGPTSVAEIELFGRGEKIAPPGLDCLCCYLPRCDKVPHCQALIEPAVVIAAVQRQLAAARPTR